MLADCFPPRSAGLPVPVLHNVALHLRWLHTDAEAGQGGIPNDVILGARGELIDRGFGQLLHSHGTGRFPGKREVSTGKRISSKAKVSQEGAGWQIIAIY